MLRIPPLRLRRSCALVSRSAQHFSQALVRVFLIVAICWMPASCSAGVHESMIFSATSRRDCNICELGLGPSSRLRPSVFHGSVVSKSKASAARSDRTGVVSVAVARVCHVGICVWLVLRVEWAAMMSSPFRVNSPSMYCSYIRCGS